MRCREHKPLPCLALPEDTTMPNRGEARRRSPVRMAVSRWETGETGVPGGVWLSDRPTSVECLCWDLSILLGAPGWCVPEGRDVT